MRTGSRRGAVFASTTVLVGAALFQFSSPAFGMASAESVESAPLLSEAVRIRSELGLESDAVFVMETFADASRFPVRDFYGIPLSNVEAVELDRRISVQQSVKSARRWASNQPGWAGAFTDQLSGGVPVFVFSGDPERYRDELTSLIPLGTTFRLQQVSRSLVDLVTLKQAVMAMWPTLESEGIPIQSVGPDIVSNSVAVGVTGLTKDAESRILGLFPTGVVVEDEQPLVPDACTSRIACGSPIKGGIRITPPNGGWCTVAYIGELYNYSPAHLRVVTAGHCIYYGGGIGVTWSHNGVGFGTSTVSTWTSGSSGDVGVITVANDSFDDNLVYASTNTDIRHFTSYALLGDIGVNDFMCRSGAKTGYLCGRVYALDKAKDVDGRTIDHQNVVDFDASPGDSGAPYMINSEFDGIHSDSTLDTAPLPHYAWYTPYVWASYVVPGVAICLTSVC